VRPGWNEILSRFDLANTSVISVEHPDVIAAYAALDWRVKRLEFKQQAEVRDLVFARKRFIDVMVPRLRVLQDYRGSVLL
jgi:hypothetical protein